MVPIVTPGAPDRPWISPLAPPVYGCAGDTALPWAAWLSEPASWAPMVIRKATSSSANRRGVRCCTTSTPIVCLKFTSGTARKPENCCSPDSGK